MLDDSVTTIMKRAPVVLRMVILILSTMLGVYIFFVCLNQGGIHANNKYGMGKNSSANAPKCHISGIMPGETVHVHFPKPKTFSRKECICNPVQFFAILSMQRSGSGWFETFLNSHINVSSNGEIFSVKERRNNISALLTTLDRVYNLDWFSSAAKNECSAAVGFKWMLNQGALKYHLEVTEYFIRRGVSVIFLLRRNLLRRMVSILANAYDRDVKLLNGAHKSHVHSEAEAKVLAQFKPVINTTTLVADLQRAEDMATQALEYFKNIRHIVLYYEELVNNRTKLIDVIDFLRLPRLQLRSRQVKIHTMPLASQITNWDDVYKTLKGTKYEVLLEVEI